MFLDTSFLENHVVCLLLLALFVLLYKYATNNLDYWKKRNVPGPSPKPFVGNLWEAVIFKENLPSLIKRFHDYADSPYIGIFTFGKPALVIRDRETIKTILQKDFANFNDHVMYNPKHNEVFNNLLFVQRNPEWKYSRTKMTPVFTSAKLKNLFNIIKNVCEEMIEYIQKSEKHDAANIGTKLSTEVTTQTFFGIKGGCFEEGTCEVLTNVQAMFGFSFRNALVQSLYFTNSKLVDLFRLDFFGKEIEIFFTKIFWKCMKMVEVNKINSNSFIGLLADLEKNDPKFSKYY